MCFAIVEQQTVAIHIVAALLPDQAAHFSELTFLYFNEHLTSSSVTLIKSKNTVDSTITHLYQFCRSEGALQAAFEFQKA